MIGQEKENDIKKLTDILSKVQNLYYKKKEHLEELKIEISELREILNTLNSMISTKSFFSADELYSNTIKKLSDDALSDDYFIQEIPNERVKGTSIKRKIYSKHDESKAEMEKKIVAILNFKDFSNVDIKFNYPEESAIKETSEAFINIFLRGALISIKEKNPELKVNNQYLKNTDIIEFINIEGIKSIEDYDLITLKIRELLASN